MASSDDVNIAEDAEMAECDGDKVVTMMDVLQEQQEIEEDANAVLGASDDKNCTYSKGYIKRQALYACLTCCTEAKVDPTKRAGVCLACSLNCHENHELIELYTKRNFRCDCGNPKFNSHPCQFTPDKTDLNNDNIYNQNFSGLYCICQRPYPDPESTIVDDMIQCIICEDWLHASHLEAVVPANDQYSEMVCKSCMEKNEFLHDYSMFAVTAEAENVDIVTVNGDANLCNGELEKGNLKLVNGVDENKTETTSVTVDKDVEMDEDKATDSTDNKKDEENVAAETNEETKQEDISNVESSELKHEDNEKADNVDNAIDTESNIAEEKEQSVGIPETKELADSDADSKPEDLNVEQKETTENTSDISNDKSNAAENIDETEQNKETATEKPDNIDENPETSDSIADDKMESTDSDPEKGDQTIKEQNEEQNSEGDKVGDGDKTDTSEKTEQQLLADLTALTADNPDSTDNIDSRPEENTETATEEKSEENMEQSEDNKEKENAQTNNEESPEDTVTQSEEQPDEKAVVDDESATDNIEVPDTSQDSGKEDTVEKADSVMDAIDELLQTANEAKEKETDTTESENKENTSNETSDDVEMNTSEKKDDDEVPEKTENDTSEPNDKLSTNNTDDIEMSDTTKSESIVDEPAPESENKDANVAEITKNESVTDKPEVTDKANESTSQENITSNETDDKLETLNETESSNKNEIEPSKDDNELPVTENGKEHKRKLSTDLTDDISSKKAKLECVRPKEVKRVHKGATFWPSNFRQKLCTCGECLSMYKDLKVLFLTDLEDTVLAYESLGKENVTGRASQYEKGMLALSSLDRTQQINALTEYNIMRDKLLDFLKSFKERKEIVKEEDIKAFFAGMKPRREPDGVYFCR